MENTGVIVYLSCIRDIEKLKESLKRLDLFFNDQFSKPVIIFHEDFSIEIQKEILNATKSRIHFQNIIFTIPDFLDKSLIPETIYYKKWGFNIGYRNMCRFFAGEIFQHTSLQKYKYIWRLDSDSYLLAPIKYDVFNKMAEEKYVYGYQHIEKDVPEVSKDLWTITKKYISDHQINPTYLSKFLNNGEWDRSYYYTNFEIIDIDYFKSNVIKNFYQYLDKSGGIYYYRWGDAIIRLLTLAIFSDESKVHQFSDIAYQHQYFINRGA